MRKVIIRGSWVIAAAVAAHVSASAMGHGPNIAQLAEGSETKRPGVGLMAEGSETKRPGIGLMAEGSETKRPGIDLNSGLA